MSVVLEFPPLPQEIKRPAMPSGDQDVNETSQATQTVKGIVISSRETYGFATVSGEKAISCRDPFR